MTATAIQLYTLRDIDAPLPDVIDRVAAAGYDGVEFAHRVREADQQAVRNALERENIEAVGAHVELPPLESEFDSLLERYEAIGCTRIVLGHVSSERFRTVDRVRGLAADLCDLADRLDDRGFDLAYHTTRHDFVPTVDRFGLEPLLAVGAIPNSGWNHIADTLGRAFRFDESDLDATGFGHLLAETDAEVLSFEVDVKSIAPLGLDPTAVFDYAGDRLSLVHISDIRRSRRFPPKYESVEPGTGLVDIDAALGGSIQSDAEWMVYENDRSSDPERSLQHGATTLSAGTKTPRSLRQS